MDNKLEQFFAGRFPFVRITSFAHFVKDGVIQSAVHELKYRNNPQIGEYLGQLSGREMLGSAFLEDVDFLVPVPLHPTREKERGYNQSDKIADGLSIETGIPVLINNLIRTKNTLSQTKHARFERWANTEGIFKVNAPAIFSNKHVLLIDDILTTGSTLESCARTLLESCENTKVSIFTIGAVV